MARLLVASDDGNELLPVGEERTALALGEEISRYGNLSAQRLSETAVVRLTPNSRGGLLERPSFG